MPWTMGKLEPPPFFFIDGSKNEIVIFLVVKMSRLSLKNAVFYGMLSIPITVALNSGAAKAILLFELIQQDANVQVKLSGSLSGLPGGGSGSSGSAINGLQPFNGHITVGVPYGGPAYAIGDPGGFGLNPLTFEPIQDYSGQSLGLLGSTGVLVLSTSYSEGSQISGSGIIIGRTLSSLGLGSTSGLLKTYTIGSDFIQVWAGPAGGHGGVPVVPGPLPLLGAAAAFAYSRKLRSRVRASSSLRS